MNPSELDLNLLRVLHVVMDEMSVSRAARRLHVTAPAVSNALARLREALDDPLLVRSGRGLAPTPRALELAPALAEALARLDSALVVPIPFDPATSTRTLTLALSDGEQIGALPRVAARFASVMPCAHLEVVSVDTLVARGGLARSTIDAAIGPSAAEAGVRERPLYVEEAVLAVRVGHPRLGPSYAPGDLVAERHIDVHLALGRGGRGNKTADEAMRRHGVQRAIAITVPTFTAAAMVAAHTDLVAGLPRRVATALREALALEVLEPPVPVTFDMVLQWHDRTDADPAARCFRDLVVEALTT